MKLAIPMVEGQMSMHFGHCEFFRIYTVEDNKITGFEDKEPPPHAPGVIPEWVSKQGVDIVLAGGMGIKAQEMFKQSGVNVIVGVDGSKAMAEIAQDYLDNNLTIGDNCCSH